MLKCFSNQLYYLCQVIGSHKYQGEHYFGNFGNLEKRIQIQNLLENDCMENWFWISSKSKGKNMPAVLRFLPLGSKGEKKRPQILSKFVFYLLIPYKNIPKRLQLSKTSNGKWVQQPSQIDPQYWKFLAMATQY